MHKTYRKRAELGMEEEKRSELVVCGIREKFAANSAAMVLVEDVELLQALEDRMD